MAFTQWGMIQELQQRLSYQTRQDSANAARTWSLEDRLGELELQNAVQRLLLSSLVKLLVDRKVVSEQELSEIVRQIDLSDGQADGKLDAPIDATGKVLPKPAVAEDTAIQELAAVVEKLGDK